MTIQSASIGVANQVAHTLVNSLPAVSNCLKKQKACTHLFLRAYYGDHSAKCNYIHVLMSNMCPTEDMF